MKQLCRNIQSIDQNVLKFTVWSKGILQCAKNILVSSSIKLIFSINRLENIRKKEKLPSRWCLQLPCYLTKRCLIYKYKNRKAANLNIWEAGTRKCLSHLSRKQKSFKEWIDNQSTNHFRSSKSNWSGWIPFCFCVSLLHNPPEALRHLLIYCQNVLTELSCKDDISRAKARNKTTKSSHHNHEVAWRFIKKNF